jgi:hypothetical protein
LTIKKKDGTDFRLQGPNPIMTEQELWDKYTLHNFASDEEFIHAAPTLPTFESLDDVQTEEIEVSVKETPVPPQPPKKKHPDKNTIRVLCLPATFQQTIDPVYGETKSTLMYGRQFAFDCEVEDTNDITCRLKTNLMMVEKQSIIFFPKERRWWKVASAEKNKDVLILNCLLSDIQPSFT